MSKPIRSSGFRYWLVPLSLGLLVASATVSVFSYWSIAQKIDQCDRLIAALNDGQSVILTSKIQDASSSYQFAQTLEKVTLKLGLVHLEDSQLQEYQLEFARMYRQLTQAFRQIGQVLTLAHKAGTTREALKEIERARNDVQSVQIAVIQTARDADRLIRQVNRYCAR